ncbi:hypothetical protein [Pontibacter sp. HSC-36F09]|uniref:hypothetical protein n=1 Tax=Pontibacter sp. HSC-36F09 TaxID=2910966 RepID=UPI00209D5A98|nr:hypothetical protein [Pontibacter sp. HSC-36F09]MCP2042756.1 hypothetical protein [Pontibacter sp. HSC-36F09]
MKKYLLISALFLFSCSSANVMTPESNVSADEKLQWRKDYAFCACLHHALGEEIAGEIKEIDFSRGMLHDIADLGGVSSSLDSMALEAASKITVSRIKDFGDSRPIVFECLQFHRSKELDMYLKSIK